MSKYINVFHFLFVAAGILFQTQPVFARQDVQFFGVVTNTTCDVGVEVDGARGNVVNLGRVGADNTGSHMVSFTIRPDINQPGCQTLTEHDLVTMTWAGNFTSPSGFLAAQSGEASDATVYIIHDQLPYSAYIMRDSLSTHVDGQTFLKNGFTYVAALVPATLKGTFQSAAAFAINYN